jgi:hypothetical protein
MRIQAPRGALARSARWVRAHRLMVIAGWLAAVLGAMAAAHLARGHRVAGEFDVVVAVDRELEVAGASILDLDSNCLGELDDRPFDRDDLLDGQGEAGTGRGVRGSSWCGRIRSTIVHASECTLARPTRSTRWRWAVGPTQSLARVRRGDRLGPDWPDA